MIDGNLGQTTGGDVVLPGELLDLRDVIAKWAAETVGGTSGPPSSAKAVPSAVQ